MNRLDRIAKLKNGTETARWAAEEIGRLEREIYAIKGNSNSTIYEKAPWWANPDIPPPKITC